LNSAFTKVQRCISAAFVGIFFSGFVFFMLVERYFEDYRRPKFPDPSKGFTYLVHNKMGNFYGTPFEGFVAKYGLLCIALPGLLGVLLFPEIRAGEKLPDTVSVRVCGLGSVIFSLAALLIIWWISS
jgi:hypothetical protein